MVPQQFSGSYGQVILAHATDIVLGDITVAGAATAVDIFKVSGLEIQHIGVSGSEIGISLFDVSGSSFSHYEVSDAGTGMVLKGLTRDNVVSYGHFADYDVGVELNIGSFQGGVPVSDNTFSHNVFDGNVEHISFAPQDRRGEITGANTFTNTTVIEGGTTTVFDGAAGLGSSTSDGVPGVLFATVVLTLALLMSWEKGRKDEIRD